MPQASSASGRPRERRDAVEHDQRAGVARGARDRLDGLADAGRRLGVDEGDERRAHARDRFGHRVVVEHVAPVGIDARHARARAASRPRTCARRRRRRRRSRPRRRARRGSRSRPPCRRCRSPRAGASCGSRSRRAGAGAPAPRRPGRGTRDRGGRASGCAMAASTSRVDVRRAGTEQQAAQAGSIMARGEYRER